ncbi:MAG: SMP-30/gluconolactonase/LRE family protein [Acidimicrobiia bacterium]|nr:MAG: SMP-30/gluconolactonase/LRE family protein [Acidimicrobiia bacterium]
MSVEVASDIVCECGEGAVWSVDTGTLLYVDIPGCTVYEYDPAGPSQSWLLDSPIGCVAVHESGGIVVALPDGYHLLDRESGDVSPLAILDHPDPRQRFNDGAVDSEGRFWAGTMLTNAPEPERIGRVWRLGAEGIDGPFFDPLYTANGMAFSPDGKRMYLSDSHPDLQTVWVFDYDPDTGQPSNGRVFVDMHSMAGRPDGAAVDSEGCYWIACVGGGEIARFDPMGRLDRLLPVPVAKPTKVAFGGRDMSTLYITSMSGDGSGPDGRLLAIDVDVPGIAVDAVTGNLGSG